jgi:hypothetical protein
MGSLAVSPLNLLNAKVPQKLEEFEAAQVDRQGPDA